MISTKLALILSVVVLMLAYCLHQPTHWHHVFHYVNEIPVLGPLLHDAAMALFHPPASATSAASTPPATDRLFTAEQLSHYAGEKGLYLVILGLVYDVTKGERFYAKGKTYHGFTGQDASRAFITGDFSKEGLRDDVLDFTAQQMLSLDHWLETYKRDYPYLGKMIGRYYDDQGQPTEYHRDLMAAMAKAKEWEKQAEDLKKQFPPCDSQYVKGEGGKVYCTKTSGGIQRTWVGFPRKMFNQDTGAVRCACVEESRLSDPRLSEYPGCDKRSTVCITSTS